MKDHDVRALIFRMGREVAIKRCIRILFTPTTNLHDLPREADGSRQTYALQHPIRVRKEGAN